MKRLQRIKSGALSRGLSLARMTVAVGSKAASHAMGELFAAKEKKQDRLKDLLVSQVEILSKELGQLKGSLMKVGQLLSMFGEHFLTPEANAFLKTLQSQSPPLEWQAIERVLKKQLTQEQLNSLEIDPEPIASASLGQVHRARRKSDGKWLAMKVQYPGVDGAIESDLKVLRSILSIAKVIPKGPKYDEIFREIKTMLQQEVDYVQEAEKTQMFRTELQNDRRFIVPEVIAELSTKRVLTTTLLDGLPVDSPEIQSLPQERRDALGFTFLDLYWREIFRLGTVQTDAHFGNYRVKLSQNQGEPDQFVLFDFGAVRKFSKKFLDPYYEMVRGSFLGDPMKIERGAQGLGFLSPDDSLEIKQLFYDLCILLSEPFSLPGDSRFPSNLMDETGAYDFGSSDLPKRVAKKAGQLALAWKFRSPPRELVFLDRKMGGVFIFLSALKVKVRSRELLAQYVD